MVAGSNRRIVKCSSRAVVRITDEFVVDILTVIEFSAIGRISGIAFGLAYLSFVGRLWFLWIFRFSFAWFALLKLRKIWSVLLNVVIWLFLRFLRFWLIWLAFLRRTFGTRIAARSRCSVTKLATQSFEKGEFLTAFTAEIVGFDTPDHSTTKIVFLYDISLFLNRSEQKETFQTF